VISAGLDNAKSSWLDAIGKAAPGGLHFFKMCGESSRPLATPGDALLELREDSEKLEIDSIPYRSHVGRHLGLVYAGRAAS